MHKMIYIIYFISDIYRIYYPYNIYIIHDFVTAIIIYNIYFPPPPILTIRLPLLLLHHL